MKALAENTCQTDKAPAIAQNGFLHKSIDIIEYTNDRIIVFAAVIRSFSGFIGLRSL